MKTQFITRTISYSRIRITTTDLDTMEMNTREWTVPGDFSDLTPRELLKEIRETMESDKISVAAAKIVGTTTEKRIMSLEDFIKYSSVAEDKKKEEKSAE